MKRACFVLLVSIFSVSVRAHDARELCQELLSLSPEGASALPPAVVHEMAARFGRGSRAASMDFAASLRVVVDNLIEQNKITAQQAEHVFADRVLGAYAPIFLRFAIAELKARDFDDDRITDFVIHFENAFGAEEQIDFAVAVARRMLVTVNDAASWSSTKGLDRFLQMLKAFGVDAETYANFLETWKYVRTAHPQTVVHFILANVRNAGDLVTAEANRQVDESRAAAEQGTLEISLWNTLFGPRSSRGAGALDLRATTRKVLDLEVPEFIQNVEGLIVDDTPPEPRLDRFFGEGSDEDFAERLELYSPPARNFLVENRLNHLSHGQLHALSRSPVFPKLSPELQAKVRSELQPFAALTKLGQEIQRQLVKDSREFEKRERLRRSEVVDAIFAGVQKKFDGRKADDDSDEAHKLSVLLMNVFAQVEKDHQFITPREFMAVSRRLVTLVFTTMKGYLALATVETLANLSKEYELPKQDVQELIELMESMNVLEPGYDDHYTTLDNFDETSFALYEQNWGDRQEYEEVITSDDVTPRLSEFLTEFRKHLPEEEAHDLADDELLEKLKEFEPIKNTKTKGS